MANSEGFSVDISLKRKWYQRINWLYVATGIVYMLFTVLLVAKGSGWFAIAINAFVCCWWFSMGCVVLKRKVHGTVTLRKCRRETRENIVDQGYFWVGGDMYKIKKARGHILHVEVVE